MERRRNLLMLTLMVMVIWGVKGEIPDPVINATKEMKFPTVGDISGKYFTMMISVSPDAKKVCISRRTFDSEDRTKNPEVLVYEIDGDDLLNEKKFPQTDLTLGLAFLLSGTRGVTMSVSSSDVGHLQYYTIGDEITEEVAKRVDLDDPSMFKYDIKKSANLAIATRRSGAQEFFYIDLTTGEERKRGLWIDVASEFTPHTFLVARFNPTESINQILVLGGDYVRSLIDFSKHIAGDNTGAKLYSNDEDWSGHLVLASYSFAEYNHKDTSHFLYTVYIQSDAKPSIGLLIKITDGYEFEVKVPLKFGYTSGQFYSFVNPKNIQGTDYFFVQRFSTYKMDLSTVETFIVDSTYIDGTTTELAFKDVTSLIKPAGTSNFNILEMEVIDKYTGKWGIVGNDGTDGYAMIATFGPPYQFTCHTNCRGCSAMEDPTKCLGCSDQAKGLTIEGEASSCGNCHEVCDGCSVAGDKTKCLKCATGYVEKSGACETEDRNSTGKTQLATMICGNTTILGCELCSEDPKQGCQRCQRGAGIEIIDEFNSCINCPDPNCEICRMTRHGRQCQKCFNGFHFDPIAQKCSLGIFTIGAIALLVWLLVR